MSKKKSSQRKPSSPSAEAGEYDDLPESISSSILQDLLKAQECMFKSFMESIVSNLISRIDNLVKDFAGLNPVWSSVKKRLRATMNNCQPSTPRRYTNMAFSYWAL